MWRQCKLWHNLGLCYSPEVTWWWDLAISQFHGVFTSYSHHHLIFPINIYRLSSFKSFKILFAWTPTRTVAHPTASYVICPYLILSFLLPFACLSEIKDARSQHESWTLFTPNLCCFHFYACKYKLLLEPSLNGNIPAHGRKMQHAQLLSLNPVSQHFFRESTLIKCASIFHYIWRICRSSFRKPEAWKSNWVAKSSLLYGANCNYTLKWLKPSSRQEIPQWLLYPLIPLQTAVDGIWINICWKCEWEPPNLYLCARLIHDFPRFMIKHSHTPSPLPLTLLLIMFLQANVYFLSG